MATLSPFITYERTTTCKPLWQYFASPSVIWLAKFDLFKLLGFNIYKDDSSKDTRFTCDPAVILTASRYIASPDLTLQLKLQGHISLAVAISWVLCVPQKKALFRNGFCLPLTLTSGFPKLA